LLQRDANKEHGSAWPALEFDKPAMAAQKFLRARQAQARSIRPTGDQWKKDSVLQLDRDARPIVFDFN